MWYANPSGCDVKVLQIDLRLVSRLLLFFLLLLLLFDDVAYPGLPAVPFYTSTICYIITAFPRVQYDC